MNNKLDIVEFAKLFGIQEREMPDDCLRMIDDGNFKYDFVDSVTHDNLILEIIKKIDAGAFSLAGEKGKDRWEVGWGENLDDFRKSKYDFSKLVPKYIRPGQPLRLNQQYIQTEDPNFELKWYFVFRHWLFKHYLKDMDAVYEFGCGSGFNLAALAQLYPEKQLFGMDWSQSSVDIVDEMAKYYGYKMKGKVFDFFNPDYYFKILPNSAIITIGAIEQTGKRFKTFLDYVLESKPKLVINIEPLVEWYDSENLVDYMAIRFHLKREYMQGYPPAIEQLAKQGKVKIIKQKRSHFGSLYLEGYSQLIWEPVG